MTIVEARWAPEYLGVSDVDKRSKALDEEVEKYSKWLAALPDYRASGALNNSERALIKTYLVQKLNGTLDGEG